MGIVEMVEVEEGVMEPKAKTGVNITTLPALIKTPETYKANGDVLKAATFYPQSHYNIRVTDPDIAELVVAFFANAKKGGKPAVKNKNESALMHEGVELIDMETVKSDANVWVWVKYQYRAFVTAVYDGDTITVDIDLGFNAWQKGMKLRLYGINTPEVRGPERAQGLISRDWLREQILNKLIIIHTHRDKKGKYGRWLAEIYSADMTFENSYNAQLVDAGLAELKDY